MVDLPESSRESGNSEKFLVGSLEGLPGAQQNIVELYDNLRGLAHKYVNTPLARQEIPPTALVHEAYLKLEKVKGLDQASKTKYFSYAAKAMREILLNHYRTVSTKKRGGDMHRTTFDEAALLSINDGDSVVAVDEALRKLEEIDEFRARIVEMRFFAGMTIDEIAEATGRSRSTIKNKWTAARMWLRAEMSDMIVGDDKPNP